MNVPAGAKLDMFISGASIDTVLSLASQDSVLKRLARLETISKLEGEVPNGSISVVVGEATYYLPLADIIDIDAEKARLLKGLEKIQKEIISVSGRLNNDSFVSKAPKHVIEENKRGLEETKEKASKTQQALDRLISMQ